MSADWMETLIIVASTLIVAVVAIVVYSVKSGTKPNDRRM